MFGLNFSEILLAAFVGLLLFGGSLPKVAAEAASWFVKLKRSLNDLRRDTGIDREIENARRAIEDTVPSDVKTFNLRSAAEETIARPLREAAGEFGRTASAPAQPVPFPTPPPPPPAPAPGYDRREDAAG